MISVAQIREIIAQYQKHGWILRRVLLSDEFRVRFYNDLVALSQSSAVEFVTSDINAAWFSRPSPGRGDGAEAWELRRLAETPFALFEVFAADDDEETREETRREMEKKLKASAVGGR
jgi:hypothetical protein